MNLIIDWASNLIFNKLPMYAMGFLFAYCLMALYCSIFQISHAYFYVYYILPIFSLIVMLINIIKIFITFPYYITIEVWNIIVRIFSMFTVIKDLINAISSFFINLTISI